jgi:DNA-directed RNA polymerase subunit RPC12/RpoP
MDIRIEQRCPQCGAAVERNETDQVLTCGYCGTKHFLQSNGPPRYLLPLAGKGSSAGLLLAPYLRFKGTIYLVTLEGIEHRVIDTTQAANPAPGLPPSLGLRPQAMRLRGIDPMGGNLYLPQTLKASAILEKAAATGNLAMRAGEGLCHRAYIGEHFSYLYLPLMIKERGVYDGVTDARLVDLQEGDNHFWQGKQFDDAWQVQCVATLCPQCGDNLDGASDCQVMTCTTCHSAWSLDPEGLTGVDWHMQPAHGDASLYVPFWKVATHLPALNIYSFADFVERSNQPFLPRPQWQDRVMSVWVPAVRLRPKNFLQIGRQVTLGQWRLTLTEGRVTPNLFPVTLPASEARQAVKLMLAAATASPRAIFPYLPQVRPTGVTVQLVYLPFSEKGPDWVQPETGVTINKTNLRLGRLL